MKVYQDENLVKQIYNCYYQVDYVLPQSERVKFHTHFHEFYEILILVDGEIDMIVQEKIYHIRANELAIVQPNMYHIVVPPDKAYKRIVLHFSLNEKETTLSEKLSHTQFCSSMYLKNLTSYIQRFLEYYQIIKKSLYLSFWCFFSSIRVVVLSHVRFMSMNIRCVTIFDLKKVDL